MATLVVSYSRADQALVRAVVTLLKTALRDIEKAVFWDADIEPGDQWWEELQQHMEEAPQLFVFWCRHSSRSKEVRREFVYALDRGKRVVPVLLDNTPLSAELAPINGIDLRQAVLHVEPQPGPPAAAAPTDFPAAAPTGDYRAWRWLGATGTAAVALAAVVGWLFLRAPTEPIESAPSAPPQHPPVVAAESSSVLPLLILVVVLVVAGFGLFRLFWRKRSAQKQHPLEGVESRPASSPKREDDHTGAIPLERARRAAAGEPVLDPDATVAAFAQYLKSGD